MKSREFDLTGNQAGGNLTDDTEREYTYDAWNRIVEVVGSTTQDEIASYSYDALGRRINKKVGNSGPLNTEDEGDFFYYDGNRLLEHHHDSPTSGEDYLRQHVWGLEYIDEAVAQYSTLAGEDTEVYYILIDANYNIVALTDDAGALVQQYAYWPYGALMAAEDGAGATIDFETYPEQIATALGHQGLFYDRETGLIFIRARHLDPNLGRYNQRDPNETANLFLTAFVYNASMPMSALDVSLSVPYGDGMSLYQFVGSNPLIATDPSGRFTYAGTVGGTAVQTHLASLYNDVALSLVDAMKGIAALQLQRHAALDNMLQAAEFDFTGLDYACSLYRGFQTAMLVLSAKDLALGLSKVAIGSVKFGARVFGKLAKRAGGRSKLLGVLDRGAGAIKGFFRFGHRGKTPTRFIDGVRVVDRRTGKVFEGTVDLGPTLDRIRRGEKWPHMNDGSVFKNKEGLLPKRKEGYYTEYVHPTPGVTGPGPQRIVIGKGGEAFYTPDHYGTFIPITP